MTEYTFRKVIGAVLVGLFVFASWSNASRAEKSIYHEIYYPEALHQQPCFAHLPPANCPVAEQLAAEVISLPVYPEMTEEQVSEVAEKIRTFDA